MALRTSLLMLIYLGHFIPLCVAHTRRGVAANVAASHPSKTQPVPMQSLSQGSGRPISIFYEDPPMAITDAHKWSGMFTPEEKLVAQLLQRGSLTVRPNGFDNLSTNPVYVDITYNVVQILAFLTENGVSKEQRCTSLKAGIFFCAVKWLDPRLTWSPDDYSGMREVSVPATNLWMPDVGVMNAKSSTDFDFSAGARGRLTLNYQGEVTWLHGAILDTTCPLDVAFFPFDYQTCFLILTPWQSGERQFLLRPFSHGPAVDNSYLPNSNVSEWEIQSVHFSSKKYRSDLNVTYQYISIGIHLKRQPLYFIVLVLVPFSMLSALACLIFTLDDTGDRLSVALSLVLSMTMYVVIVSSNAPRSMRTLPVLGIFLLDQLGLLSVATVLAVINNRLFLSPPLKNWQDLMYAISGTGESKGSDAHYLARSCKPTKEECCSDRNLYLGKSCNSTQLGDLRRRVSAEARNSHELHYANRWMQQHSPSKLYPYSKGNASRQHQSNDPRFLQNQRSFADTTNIPSWRVDNTTSNSPMINANCRKVNTNFLPPNQNRNHPTNTLQVVHHPMCSKKLRPKQNPKQCTLCNMNSKTPSSPQSPWVEPLGVINRANLNQLNSSESSQHTSSSSSLERRRSSSRIFQTTITATAAAALAATKVLTNSYLSSQHVTKNLPTLQYSGKSRTERSNKSRCVERTPSASSIFSSGDGEDIPHESKTAKLAAAAVAAAFQAASYVSAHKNCSLHNNHHYCKPKKRLSSCAKISRNSFLSAGLDPSDTPYRKLAARLDCIEMITYLLLSTVNAVVCLLIMPRYMQNTGTPDGWVT